ncbi:peptidoglycan recognition family protein [Winogradskyella sp.]|uniref:peptidoglycan recognition protein family protein n=1 Tax=Winogradskyella sp. TaxID=1883156 RepID=UPI0026259B22|nr:peptidoglycan recognition family protein [Winogradskyella sp.]
MAKKRKKDQNIFPWAAGIFVAGMLLFSPKRSQARGSVVYDDRYSDFSLARSTTASYATRLLSDIDKIIVHHAGVEGQTAEDYARYHVNTKGRPGISYHLVIEKDGLAVIGNPLENVPWHTSGENERSIGIVLSGNFDETQPTPAQLRTLELVIRDIRNQLPQPIEVYGHQDFAATSCPGDNLYPLLNQFKL